MLVYITMEMLSLINMTFGGHFGPKHLEIPLAAGGIGPVILAVLILFYTT
jgi:hypothetical protein